MSDEYAYIRTRPNGEQFYYYSDTATAHTCTDEHHEAGYRTTIAFWGGSDE